MVQLTDVIIKGKTRCDRLDDVKNLNVWGQDITDITILQHTPNLEVLSLSINGITSLKHIMHCKGLKELYLRKNMVADINDIRFLMPLHQLKVLWLSDNPCADIPNYRSFVIAHLTSLEKLDNLDITPEERKAAHSIPLMQPATASELLETEDTGPGAASGTSPRPISPSSIAASGTSPRPMSPSSIAGSAAAGSPVPAGPQPPSSRSRVPGGSAAVHADPYSSHAAPMGLLVGNSSSRDSAYDATIGSVSSSGAAAAGRSAAGVAEESFAFSRQQYDPHRYSSQPGMPPVQQQLPQLPRPDAAVPTNSNSNSSSSGAGSSHMKASPNVLYAVMALLAELDAAGLSIVQKEVEQRLKG